MHITHMEPLEETVYRASLLPVRAVYPTPASCQRTTIHTTYSNSTNRKAWNDFFLSKQYENMSHIQLPYTSLIGYIPLGIMSIISSPFIPPPISLYIPNAIRFHTRSTSWQSERKSLLSSCWHTHDSTSADRSALGFARYAEKSTDEIVSPSCFCGD